MSGGARAIDSLLPGTLSELLAAGAHQHQLPHHLVRCRSGWLSRRLAGSQYLISCSRSLVDWVVHRQVLANPKVVLREATDVDALLGDRAKVTGVRVRDRNTGEQHDIEADLVVDATGRGSRIQHWLPALGVPEAREEVVDSGLSYATRIYQAPPARLRTARSSTFSRRTDARSRPDRDDHSAGRRPLAGHPVARGAANAGG